MTYRESPQSERPAPAPIRQRLAKSRYARRIRQKFRTRHRAFIALVVTPLALAAASYLAAKPLAALTGNYPEVWEMLALCLCMFAVMAATLATVTFYRCPNCGGSMASDEGEGGIEIAPRKCRHCHMPLR